MINDRNTQKEQRHVISSRLSRWAKMLILASALVATLGVATNAAAAGSPAPMSVATTARAHPLGPKEQRWFDTEQDLLSDEMAATTDYGDLLTQAGDDPSLLFDPTWIAELTDVLDTFDRVHAKQQHLNAPTRRTKKIERQFDTMFAEAAASGSDMRLFLATYDVDYLYSATDHITTATAAAQQVTDLITDLNDEITDRGSAL